MKKLILLILSFVFVLSVQAQLHGYKWRFGASAGTTNYFGDIRPMPLDNFKDFTKYYKRYSTYSEQLSYQVSIEYALGNSVGLMLTGGSYQFGSGDRFVKNDGTLLTESPSFDRALNFQTDVYDAGLSFVIKPDNNWLLSGKSFFAPYLTIGAGVQSFNVHGDLLDATRNLYDYSNPTVIPDGNFETNLSKLGTERTKNYETTSFYANLGLGVRFRITKTIELFAQSDFKRTNTDYLDDVSGVYRTSYDNDFQAYAAKPGTNNVSAENPYRGFKNGRPDWYIYHGIGIKFSFGANKTSFNPPVITQRYTYVPTAEFNAQIAKKDSVETSEASNVTVTNNYFTVVQLSNQGRTFVNQDTLNSTSLSEVNFMIDSLEERQVDFTREISSAQRKLATIDETISIAQQDSSVSEEIKQLRIQNLDQEKSLTQERINEIITFSTENQVKLDSLTSLKRRSTPTSYAVDSASMIQELMVYPGQVSRILYSSYPSVLSLDSIRQSKEATTRYAASPETMTLDEFEEEMTKFRQDLLSAQATRDSAMMIAFANKTPLYTAPQQMEYYPQELPYYPQGMDDKTAKRLEKNRKKQENYKKKNNELLKDALLVGGAVATTAAISSSGDKKKEVDAATNDSTLRARIALDSLIIDSLSNVPRVIDTVTVTVTEVEVIEKNVQTFLNESKVEVYFDINESSLSDQERNKLSPVSNYLKKNPEFYVQLVGFADNTGSVTYNLALTEKRVEEVSKTLTDYYNISPAQISVSSGGLIIRGRSKGSVETDRKVEIRLLKK
ncbi:OmpA family protein [Algoriphagus sp. D3-2-R+10]|uniref:OmpA family protein n=1 Tax=Algoriphagus aurantiacus TaxID=3103948 RepID=UPI002B3D81C5|nr:OmpA family protein [Algoriphagus sp. D3-2-R+10]MEB2775175.1 OmpA family protein [Algoriphagus sp. D3-2-R+10]